MSARGEVAYYTYAVDPENKFLNVIGTKVFRVFLTITLLTDFTPPSPLEQKWFETGL
jgi:hypothetical protein